MFGGLTEAADSYISTLKQVHRRNYRTRCSLQRSDAPLKITLKADARHRFLALSLVILPVTVWLL